MVEDELSIANFIVDVVQMLGFETKMLTTGAKVLQTALEWKPDLITLDLMMPSPDGIEVLRQLKGESKTELIPVFVISVVAQNADILGKIAKANRIFSKPLDTKLFIEEVQKAVPL